MFERTSDVGDLSASEIVTRDAKEYQLPGGETISIAQIETVGKRALERRGSWARRSRRSASATATRLRR